MSLVFWLLGLVGLLGTALVPGYAADSSLAELGALSTELVFKDPAEFKNQTYCYFVYQHIVDKAEITPERYAKYVKGSALSNSAIAPYKTWLATADGVGCRKLVGKGFHDFKADSARPYTVFLNQKAIEGDGESLETTLNHERLHVLFAQQKEQRGAILRQWAGLSDADKEKFKAAHPGYDYSNESVLLREYFSYTYESKPGEGLRLLTK